jgi:hypothetical protein
MKKVTITLLAFVVFVFPSIAQVSHDFDPNEKEPIVKATIPKDQVPEPVLRAVTIQFDKSNPQTWSKFPYALKEYGWVYNVNSSDNNLDHFLVTMKTKEGNDLEAVYSAEGALLETREMSLNVPVPKEVLADLEKSQYKGWNIVGTKEIINFYRDRNNANVERHFRITVEKDKVKKSISFDWNGEN